jgi:hypothetical protein
LFRWCSRLALNVALIYEIGMLGSKIVAFGPKSTTRGTLGLWVTLAAGAPAVVATWSCRAIPPLLLPLFPLPALGLLGVLGRDMKTPFGGATARHPVPDLFGDPVPVIDQFAGPRPDR